MKNLKASKFLAIAALIMPCLSYAQDIDLTQRLNHRNELLQVNERVKPYLFDSNVRNRIYFWLNHSQVREYVADCQLKLRPFMQNEKLVGTACYLLRQQDPKKRQIVLDLIQRDILEKRVALQELSEDPRYGALHQSRAGALKMLFDRADIKAIGGCFRPAFEARYNDTPGAAYEFSPFGFVAQCLNKNLSQITKQGGAGGKVAFLGVNLSEEFPNHPGHAISESGWIPGNRVEYLSLNDNSEQLTKILEATNHLVATHYPLSGAGSVEAFEKKIKAKKPVFTEEEGFLPIERHPVWSQKSGIFFELRKSIESARETIFSDIFFLGSTMGAAMAKRLVEIAETKGVKLFILRDNINHFGHEAEMRPVFNYLKAYSNLHPDRITIVSANIVEHRSGLPKFLWNVVKNNLIEASGLQKHLVLYARAQSDHSKVFVIDGKTQNPVAFVGSKNLTDSSGATCYDEVIKVSGPAAAIVQDDYIQDMRAALRLEGVSSEEAAQKTKGFDLLERDAQMNPSVSRVSIASQGDVQLRTGINSYDSTRTNIIDQNIQAILQAKTKILMKDQFIFDRNIVLAMIDAKRANPALDIRVILEPLHAAHPHGMPNILYLDLLKDAGIQVKAKKVVQNAVINQEYHMKTISVDGSYVIAGSANKDQTTMYGSFREQQLDVASRAAAAAHDEVFERHWNSPDETEETFSQLEFEVPYGLKGFNGQPLTPVQFIKLIRNLLSVIYDAGSI